MASAPGEHVVKVRGELHHAVVVRQGDTLIIASSKRLDMARLDEIARGLGEHLPGVELVIIDDVASMAVYRPDEPCARCGAVGKIHNVHY